MQYIRHAQPHSRRLWYFVHWHGQPRWLHAIWLALFAILLNATGPTLSQLNAAHQPDLARVLTICSVDGTQAIKLTQRGQALDLIKLLGNACPLCALHLGPGLLPLLWQPPMFGWHASTEINQMVRALPRARFPILPPSRGPPVQADRARYISST